MNQFGSIEKIPIYLLLFFLLPSCLDRISLPVPDANRGNLVIQGKLDFGTPSTVAATITRLNNFSDTPLSNWEAVSGVRLIDDENNQIDLIETDTGRYTFTIPEDYPEFNVRPGRSYQLIVTSLDGIEYASGWEPLHLVPRPDSISASVVSREILNSSENIVTRYFLNYRITTSLLTPGSNDPAYLRWQFNGCYRFIESTLPVEPPPFPRTCYVKEDLKVGQIVVFNGATATSEKLEDFLILEDLVGYRHSQGYYLTTLQQSLSEGAFNYWNRVKDVLERNGSMFENPPGKIRGNITNLNDPEEEIFGYFYASQTDTIRLKIKPETVNYPSTFCPGVAESFDLDPACFDCLLLLNSSYEKPDYWMD